MSVVIADDSVLFREGIAQLLQQAGFEIAGQSGTADDLLLKVRSYTPDVAIVDIRMPPTHTDEGLRAAREIRERHPDVGVLVLSQYVEAPYMMELLQGDIEGVGYLLKDRIRDVKEFADAVRRVAEGGSAFDPAVVSRLVGRRQGEDPLDSLTPREREVLELMAQGRSNQAIAEIGRYGGCRREARPQHLRKAPPAGQPRRSPARARGAHLPQLIAVRARDLGPHAGAQAAGSTAPASAERLHAIHQATQARPSVPLAPPTPSSTTSITTWSFARDTATVASDAWAYFAVFARHSLIT